MEVPYGVSQGKKDWMRDASVVVPESVRCYQTSGKAMLV